MAMVKHFIAYDGGNNVVVDSRTLHEIYLEPFADAINAGVASVMCSYNTVSVVAATPSAGGTPGPYSCGNSQTLTGILRGELGFRGFVTSDWGANHATSFINDGLDMEMPGTGFGDILPTYFSAADLKAAITAGTVSISTIDAAVGHILYEMDRFGLLSGHSRHNVTPEPVNADEQVVQQTGQDAATLLNNAAGALPLSHADLSHLALIGPGAGQTIAVGQARGERHGRHRVPADRHLPGAPAGTPARSRRASDVRRRRRHDRYPGARVGAVAQRPAGPAAHQQRRRVNVCGRPA